jgi:hypothetical protein
VPEIFWRADTRNENVLEIPARLAIARQVFDGPYLRCVERSFHDYRSRVDISELIRAIETETSFPPAE